VAANLHVLDHSLLGIYHVGTGKETSVNQLWETLVWLTKTTLIPEYWPPLGEIQHTSLDSKRLISTGWVISTPFLQGVSALIDGI
jgi:hypothetical protein